MQNGLLYSSSKFLSSPNPSLFFKTLCLRCCLAHRHRSTFALAPSFPVPRSPSPYLLALAFASSSPFLGACVYAIKR
ncbi:unnamed protein product [Cuscuta campestris]|uniref:Uncharacterized protein n=1 Tax=Cuscuta campestris TaxID=132261 RepID=A0A484MG01_9ASTE|nr:unnamed protein product [Cuscuta campestris]